MGRKRGREREREREKAVMRELVAGGQAEGLFRLCGLELEQTGPGFDHGGQRTVVQPAYVMGGTHKRAHTSRQTNCQSFCLWGAV